MAITLPTPIRVAAGLVGTAIDRLTTLPAELPSLGVSLAGQAFRVSLRVRQEIAELAVRGDELLSGLTGEPAERPAWATFDEEEPDAAVGPAQAGSATAEPATTGSAKTGSAKTTPTRTTPARTTPAKAESARPGDGPKTPGNDPAATGNGPAATGNGPAPTADRPATAGDSETVAELRDRIATLTADQVRRLLLVEQEGPARAARLTLLTNRLTTLEQAAR